MAIRTLLATAAAALALPAMAQALTLTVDVLGPKGDKIGWAQIDTAVGGILMRVELEKDTLEVGWHGMHFHAVGDCSDVGAYKKSGGHVGKKEGAHGLKNPRGPEPGDLPNIYVPHMHKTMVEIYVAGVSLTAAQGGMALLDEDGSALIIHASEDDHSSQPIGGAGGRVACALIK